MGLGTALAIQAGSTLVGTAANELFNDKPDVPDFSGEAAAEFNERRRDLEELFSRRRAETEADLAASGQTGSAGAATRQAIAQEFADAQADVAAKGAEAVEQAQNREKRLRFQQDRQEQQARAQAIGDLVGGVGQTLAASQLGGGESAPEAENLGDGSGGTLVDPPAESGGMRGTDFLNSSTPNAGSLASASPPTGSELGFSRFGMT